MGFWSWFRDRSLDIKLDNNMTIVEMLKKEIDEIKKNLSYANFIRNDATDIMISVRFDDNTYHHIMPKKHISFLLTQEIQRMIEEPIYWDKVRKKYLHSKLPDFVNEEEMEI